MAKFNRVPQRLRSAPQPDPREDELLATMKLVVRTLANPVGDVNTTKLRALFDDARNEFNARGGAQIRTLDEHLAEPR